jgi:hypothetical protein
MENSILGIGNSAAPAYSLFDSRAVALATFLGSPLAGCAIMAVNYNRLGNSASAVRAVVAGFVSTGLLLYLSFSTDSGLLHVLPLLLMLLMIWIAKGLQGDDVEQHVRQGGKLASRWWAAGIGLAAMAVLLLVVWACLGFAPLTS